MGKYILMIILCVVMGCVSNKVDIKDSNMNIKQDKNITKDLLYYFWVVTGGM